MILIHFKEYYGYGIVGLIVIICDREWKIRYKYQYEDTKIENKKC